MLDLVLITLSFSLTEAWWYDGSDILSRPPSIDCLRCEPQEGAYLAWLQHVGVLGSTGWSCGPERAANWSKQDSAGLVFVFTLLERRPLEQTASVSSHVAENHPTFIHSCLALLTPSQCAQMAPLSRSLTVSAPSPLPPCAVASLKVSVSGRCKKRVPREGAENNLVAFKDKVLPLFTWLI